MSNIITPELLSELQDSMWPLSKRDLTVVDDERGITIQIRFCNLSYKHTIGIFEIQNICSIEALQQLIRLIVNDGRYKILKEASSTYKINVVNP